MGTIMNFFWKMSILLVHFRTLWYPTDKLRKMGLVHPGLSQRLTYSFWLNFLKKKELKIWTWLAKSGFCLSSWFSQYLEHIRNIQIVRKGAHLNPNSIKVSFRNSPGWRRFLSPIVMLTAPGWPCGYDRILKILWAFRCNKWRSQPTIRHFLDPSPA